MKYEKKVFTVINTLLLVCLLSNVYWVYYIILFFRTVGSEFRSNHLRDTMYNAYVQLGVFFSHINYHYLIVAFCLFAIIYLFIIISLIRGFKDDYLKLGYVLTVINVIWINIAVHFGFFILKDFILSTLSFL